MGFFRQEYWSGLPFLPPGDPLDPGIELASLISCIGRRSSLALAPWKWKWKWSRSVVSDSVILWTVAVHGVFQASILEWVAIFFSRGSSRPRDWTWVSCIASRFFTPEPPGKPPGDYNMGQIWETMLVSKSLKLFAISQTSLVLSLLRNLTYPFFISPTFPSSAVRKGPWNFFQHVSLSLMWVCFFVCLFSNCRESLFPRRPSQVLTTRRASQEIGECREFKRCL